MSAGLRRLLVLWRVFAACALLSVGTPAMASQGPQPVSTEQVERTSAPPRTPTPRRAQAQPQDPARFTTTAASIPVLTPYVRVTRVDHLHLRLCVLLC
jgi:hypothetical protein